MRYLIVVSMLLLSLPVYARTPGAVVMEHECKQIDPLKTGFRCALRPAGMALHWTKKKAAMTAEGRERSTYEYSRITMRYFDLGGRHFDVTANHWPAGAKRECTIRPNRTIFCADFRCRADGKNCEPVTPK